MSDRPENLPTLDQVRLREIRDLLRHESSIKFYSARAHESMWMLYAAAADPPLFQQRPKVQGYCPMGCGQTLYLNTEAEAITCSNDDCPSPVAIDVLLENPETEHIVDLQRSTFSVQHPMRERLYGALFNCELHGYLTGLPGPPAEPGRYRVIWDPADPTATRWEPAS
jgi:hypothetical protein